MSNTKTKSFSFGKKYQREYDYIASLESPSQFICELIKKYLDEDSDGFENDVKKVMVKYLKDDVFK